MSRNLFNRAASLVMLLLSGSFIANSQDTVRTTSLDEVIVTANKFPLKTSRTGKVVNIITREQLEQSGGKDLSQVLNEQVGIYINGANSSAGKDKTVFLRGAKIDYTLITIDGVPVYDASGIGGNFDIRMIPLENVERVEILKGSQSTLYGSDAIAGVINIITKKGAQKPISVSGSLSGGSYGTLRGNATVSGSKGKLDYSVGGAFFRTDGINETLDTTGVGTNEKDRYKQNTLMANIGWRPSANVVVRPFVRYTTTEAEVDNGAFTDELDNKADQKNMQTGVQSQITIGRSTLNVLYNYNFTDRLYLDDSTKSRNGYYLFSRDAYKAHEHFAEAYVNTKLSQQWQLTAGADLRRSSTDQEHFAMDAWSTYPSSMSGDSVKQRQFGIYAALNGKFNNGFNIEAGGRWNNHSSYGSNFVYSFNPSWLIMERYKLFVNVSTAYKTPGLYQLFSEYGNKELQPESAFTVEGGIQYYDPRERFTARLVYFDRRIRDVLFFHTDPATWKSQYINQDEQNDHGVEAEATIKLGDKFRWNLNFTYVDGEIMTINNGKDTSYFNLLRRPRTNFGTAISWKPTPRLNLSANMQAYAKRDDKGFDPLTFTSFDVELKGFVLVGVYAEYGFCRNRLYAFADLRNITNSNYQEVYGYNNPGFNAYAGLRFNLQSWK